MIDSTLWSKDRLVSKHLYIDKSETTIKAVSSCDTITNPVTGKIEINDVDRNKYSVFMSASSGCPLKCKFCYLTIEDMAFKKLTKKQILSNLKTAIENRLAETPELKDKYIKLCWMGMGEAILQPTTMIEITIELLDWVIENKYAKGLDGVDISTVLPKVAGIIAPLWQLESALLKYPLNPDNKNVVHKQDATAPTQYKDRSRLRLFYSLHSAIQSTRDSLIPNTIDLDEAAQWLRLYTTRNKRNLIFHHMFMEGVNDSQKEVQAVVDWMKSRGFEDHELRVLRYNANEKSELKESANFEDCIDMVNKKLPNVKIQISAGSELKSACGQFVVQNEC